MEAEKETDKNVIVDEDYQIYDDFMIFWNQTKSPMLDCQDKCYDKIGIFYLDSNMLHERRLNSASSMPM